MRAGSPKKPKPPKDNSKHLLRLQMAEAVIPFMESPGGALFLNHINGIKNSMIGSLIHITAASNMLEERGMIRGIDKVLREMERCLIARMEEEKRQKEAAAKGEIGSNFPPAPTNQERTPSAI